MLPLLNNFSNISQSYVEYIARTNKYYKDCSKVKLLKIIPFLVFRTSSFLSEVCTVRIIFFSVPKIELIMLCLWLFQSLKSVR